MLQLIVHGPKPCFLVSPKGLNKALSSLHFLRLGTNQLQFGEFTSSPPGNPQADNKMFARVDRC